MWDTWAKSETMHLAQPSWDCALDTAQWNLDRGPPKINWHTCYIYLDNIWIFCGTHQTHSSIQSTEFEKTDKNRFKHLYVSVKFIRNLCTPTVPLNKLYNLLYMILKAIAWYFGKHPLLSFWESDENIDTTLVSVLGAEARRKLA